MVWINDHMYSHGACQCSWGGVKDSGLGRAHSQVRLLRVREREAGRAGSRRARATSGGTLRRDAGPGDPRRRRSCSTARARPTAARAARGRPAAAQASARRGTLRSLRPPLSARATVWTMPAQAYAGKECVCQLREGLRPVLRAGDARHPLLHRLPAADAAAAASWSAAARWGWRRSRACWRATATSCSSRPTRCRRCASTPREGSIAWEQREYRPGTWRARSSSSPPPSDTDVNIRVFEDAERRAMLVNVVDVPPLCNFILPAIVRTGPLAIAICTAGASPALAKRMKRRDRRAVRRAVRAAGRDPQRGPRMGEGARCPPTRTARRSSRGSSTASPTRSSCCARATSRRCAT